MNALKSACAALAAMAALVAFAPSASAEALEAGNAQGMCIDFASGRGVLMPCSGQAPQDIQIPNRGADFLRVGRYCIAAGREGDQLYATNCKNRADQYWTYSQNGTLVNGTGLCADVERSGRNQGTRILGFDCGGKANQRFSIWQGGYNPGPGGGGYPGNGGGYQVQVLLSPDHAPGLCLDRDKKANRLILFGCHGKSNQVFVMSQSGRTEIRVNNACLTASNGNGSPVYTSNCNGSAAQTWEMRNDRTIRNQASNRCIDVSGASRNEGTPIITFKCSGKANQRFTMYQR
jgi:hypothetical protein